MKNNFVHKRHHVNQTKCWWKQVHQFIFVRNEDRIIEDRNNRGKIGLGLKFLYYYYRYRFFPLFVYILSIIFTIIPKETSLLNIYKIRTSDETFHGETLKADIFFTVENIYLGISMHDITFLKNKVFIKGKLQLM